MISKVMHFSVIIFICISLIIGNVVAAGGFGTIRGTVTDKKTGKPLYLANVIVKGTSIGAPSDKNGNYVITPLPAGHHSIMVSYMGYKVIIDKVRVGKGDTVTVDFELEEDIIQMDQIVVTASKIPTFIEEVPVRTEVITREELEDKGAVNLYQALEGLPGVRVEQQCAFCNFSMVRLQGLGPDHVQLMIDQQPVYSGLASVYGLQQVPAENIERIEVVKGAGSALYGAKAIAGVVNIITREPDRGPRLMVSSTLGSYNTNKYAIMSTAGTESMDMVITAQKSTGDEIDENGNGFADRVRTDNISLSGKVKVHGILGLDEVAITGHTVNEDRLGGEIATFENPFAEAAERIKTTRYQAGLTCQKIFSLGNELTASFNYVWHNRDATNDVFLNDYMDTHGGSIPPVDQLSPYIANERLYVTDIRYSHLLPGGQRLLAGFQYSHNNLDERGRYVVIDESDPDFGEPYNSRSQKHADDYGFYLQDEIDISEKLDAVLGTRYDIHRSEDEFGGSVSVAVKEKVNLVYKEESLNPRAALRYQLGDLNLRTSIGTGFRVPYGFSEDLHLCSGSPRVNKPPGLKPEKSISYNLGMDYSRSRFNMSVNLFRTDLENKIDFVSAGYESKQLGFDYEWGNVGSAYTRGVELGARFLLFKGFIVDLDFAYTDASYEKERSDWVDAHPEFAEESQFIPRVPETDGGIKINLNSLNANLVLDFEYTGRMYVDYYQDEDIEMPGSKIKHTEPFVIVNTRFTYWIEEWGVKPIIGAKNILDYVQDEKNLDDAAYIWAPWVGRIVYAGVELEF
jgi:outer membrane receptor for ferrienterochelin and colicins